MFPNVCTYFGNEITNKFNNDLQLNFSMIWKVYLYKIFCIKLRGQSLWTPIIIPKSVLFHAPILEEAGTYLTEKGWEEWEISEQFQIKSLIFNRLTINIWFFYSGKRSLKFHNILIWWIILISFNSFLNFAFIIIYNNIKKILSLLPMASMWIF